MISSARSNHGFTLIELMLAMTFISVLLVAVAMTTIYMSRTYSRGVSIKEVNQAGRDVSDYLRRDVIAARPVGNYFVAADASGAAGLGRFCLGEFSYVWNPAAALNSDTFVKYTDTEQPIVFARVKDSQGALCTATGGVYPVAILRSNATALIESDNYNLAVHDFKATRLNDSGAITGNFLYKVEFVLGTNEKDTINEGAIGTMDQRCKSPNEKTSNIEFCSINKFETVYYSGGAA